MRFFNSRYHCQIEKCKRLKLAAWLATIQAVRKTPSHQFTYRRFKNQRPRAKIILSQPYTSGDILRKSQEEAQQKEEESRAKIRKLEEKNRVKEEKETLIKLKKEAAEKKKM